MSQSMVTFLFPLIRIEIIPAAALLSMGGDLLSVPQPVMSQQAFHVLTDDAKHHLTSPIAGMSRAYYVAKYM